MLLGLDEDERNVGEMADFIGKTLPVRDDLAVTPEHHARVKGAAVGRAEMDSQQCHRGTVIGNA